MRSLDSMLYLTGIRLRVDEVSDLDAYPFCLPAVRHLRTLAFKQSVTFLIGENGTGKSTLLEAIAVAWGFNPEGGSRNFRFSTRSSHSELHRYLALDRALRRPRDGWFLRAESFFNLATQIEELDRVPAPAPPILDSYGGVSLHEQSHGESFFALFLERFGGEGLYILDEPEAALSPMRQLALLARVHQLVKEGAQFLVATHSPILMGFPGAEIYQLEEAGIRKARYEETEHFVVTRAFLNNPQALLRELFAS